MLYKKNLWLSLLCFSWAHQSEAVTFSAKLNKFKRALKNNDNQAVVIKNFDDWFSASNSGIERTREELSADFFKHYFKIPMQVEPGQTLEEAVDHLKSILARSPKGGTIDTSVLDILLKELPADKRPALNATVAEKQEVLIDALKDYATWSEHGSSGVPSPLSTPPGSPKIPRHSDGSGPGRPVSPEVTEPGSGTVPPPPPGPAPVIEKGGNIPPAPPLPGNSIPPAPPFPGMPGVVPPPPPGMPGATVCQPKLESQLQKKINMYQRLKKDFATAQINTFDTNDYRAMTILISVLRKAESVLHKDEALQKFATNFQGQLEAFEQALKPSDTKEQAKDALAQAKEMIQQALKELRKKAQNLEETFPGQESLESKLTAEDVELAKTIDLKEAQQAVRTFSDAQREKQKEITKIMGELLQLLEQQTKKLGQDATVGKRCQAVTGQLEALAGDELEQRDEGDDSEAGLQQQAEIKEREQDAIFPLEQRVYTGKENNPFFVSVLMRIFRPGTKLQLDQNVRAGFLTVEATDRFGIYNDLLGGQKELAKTEDGKLQLWVLGPAVKDPNDIYLLKTMTNRIPQLNARAIADDTPKVMIAKNSVIEGTKMLYLFAVELESFGDASSKNSIKWLYGKLVPQITEKKQSDDL